MTSGSKNITISSLSVTGDTPELNIQPGGSNPCPSGTLPFTLTPGSCTLLATYTATSLGPKVATLTIHSDAANPLFVLTLSGNGTATLPGAPVINSIAPWDGQATIYFSAPLNNGGSPVLDYTISGAPSGIIYPATSPYTITGLTNGTPYTFSVTARNTIGTGAAASISSTPFYAPLRIGTTGYPSNIQSLLASPSVSAGTVITAQAGPVTVTSAPLNLTKGVTIDGGYSSNYSATNDFTIIPGRVNISVPSSPVHFKRIKIK
jgi:hypothetical protein